MGRRTLSLPLALLALGLSACDAVTGSGTAQVTSGSSEPFTTSFAVDLRAGTSGEDPRGTLTLVVTFTDPTCLVVRSTPVEEPPTATANLRNPVTGQRVVAQFTTVGGRQFIGLRTVSDPADCALGSPGSVAEVVEGSFRVVDVQPRPAVTG
jgi:hypothetical protein